jgi:hypothetical protein
MDTDDNPDRDAVLNKCCAVVGGIVVMRDDGVKFCYYDQKGATAPRAATPDLSVAPPLEVSPTKPVVVPKAPLEPTKSG